MRKTGQIEFLNFFPIRQNSNNGSESGSFENLFVPEQELSRASLRRGLEPSVDVLHQQILLVAVQSFDHRVDLVLLRGQQHFDHQRCCCVLELKIQIINDLICLKIKNGKIEKQFVIFKVKLVRSV